MICIRATIVTAFTPAFHNQFHLLYYDELMYGCILKLFTLYTNLAYCISAHIYTVAEDVICIILSLLLPFILTPCYGYKHVPTFTYILLMYGVIYVCDVMVKGKFIKYCMQLVNGFVCT